MNMNRSRLDAPTAALLAALLSSPALADDPASVALLLPLHGHMAAVGGIIRDGFLAAYYQDLQQGQPAPVLRIYDNGDSQVNALVQNAARDGVDAVVGPLNKEQVAALVAAGTPPLPVLALNHADGTTSRLYQFALAPEEEMTALVNLMQQQGIKRVRVLQTRDAASDRNRQLFESAWQAAGGTVVPAFTVDTGSKGGAVSNIHRLLGDPASQQLDALFLASPALSTQLRPTMSYYHTLELPYYSLASAYDASAPDINHQDQNGMRFCDQPWIVQGGWPEQEALYSSGRTPSNYDRLYAFGGDAYGLIKTLYRTPDHADLAGRSGHLSLGDGGRIQRQPSCVELHDGHPQVLIAPGGLAPATSGT